MHASAIIFTQIVISFQMKDPLRQQSIVLCPPFYHCLWWQRKIQAISKIFNFSSYEILNSLLRHREFVLLLAGQHTPGELMGNMPRKNQRSLVAGLGPQNCKYILGWSLIGILRWILSWYDCSGFCFQNLPTLCLLSVPALWFLGLVL